MIPYKEMMKNNTLDNYTQSKNPLEVMQGENKMATIKEEANEYVGQQTKNIADLKAVDVNMNIEDREGKDKEGVVFKYKVVIVDKEEYRIPGKVLGDLKSILEKKPDLKTFAVTKTGAGIGTQYTVIPLD